MVRGAWGGQTGDLKISRGKARILSHPSSHRRHNFFLASLFFLPLMCWLCDRVAPTCGWVQAPDRNEYFMCALCSPPEAVSGCEDLEDVLEELSGIRRTAEAGTQCGTGLVAREAAPHRAAPRKRALEPGTTRPNLEIRAARVHR